MAERGVTLDTSGASQYLGALVKELNLRPGMVRAPFNEFAEYYMVRTNLLFATGSRDGVTWEKLSPKTSRKGRRTGVPLDNSPRMRASIKLKVTVSEHGASVRFSSRDKLVAIHHHGAAVPPRVIRPRSASALRFEIGGKVVFARRVNFPGAIIPARPILFIADRDRATLMRYFTTMLQRAKKEAVTKAKQKKKGTK